jgi:hypothetical protein
MANDGLKNKKKKQVLNNLIKFISIIFVLIVLTTACSEKTPASFWTNYQKNLIKSKTSDQGPWGGHREIYWKSETANTFTEIELIEFAKKNYWKLIDSISFSADTLTQNSFLKLKSDDYSLDILKDRVLTKLKSNDNRVFVFKTTWLAVEPGNTRETFENGFAILNSDGTELKIYHLWGE